MANVQFEKQFNSIKTTVEFKETWKNGTGYFDNAVFDKEINEISKSTDAHGRRIIIIPTMVGNVVVFERYKGGDVIVSNAPRALEAFAYGLELGTALSPDALDFYFGSEWGVPHIGERLETFLRLTNKLNK